MTAGIYKLTNEINGRVYIGQSIDIERRVKSHLSSFLFRGHDTKEMQEDFGKGHTFKAEVLEEVGDPGCLDDLEIHWINFYDEGDGNIYNSRFPRERGVTSTHRIKAEKRRSKLPPPVALIPLNYQG